MAASTNTEVQCDVASLLLDIFERLLAHYGAQHWWPAETPFEVIVGAILTQGAAWANVEQALTRLKDAGVLSPAGLRATGEGELALLIRPAGYFNAKARKLKAFVTMVDYHYGGRLDHVLSEDTETLRERLLSTHGIGPETADAILLYAAGQPSFVVDAYTRRVLGRVGLCPPHDDYASWRALFMENLPAEAPLMNEYHALLDVHAKALCRKRDPLCGRCPLRSVCRYGMTSSVN